MNLEAIGVIHSPFLTVEGTPIQPRGAAGIEGTVEVASALAPGLKDLDGFERIWLIYWCDRAGYDEHGLVVTPYLDRRPHGVFATRAPARPNSIGMSAVRLLEIRGNVLRISDVDVLDETPLLDIKPYVPQFDCYEVKRAGWLQGVSVENALADTRFEAKQAK